MDATEPLNCSCFALRKAARAVTQMYDQALKPSGLRATQLSLLFTAERAGAVSTGELAEQLVMDRTTLTRNLKPLLDRGLLKRVVGADRRRRPIAITAKGRAALARALPYWREAQARDDRSSGPRALGAPDRRPPGHGRSGEPGANIFLLKRVYMHLSTSSQSVKGRHHDPLRQTHKKSGVLRNLQARLRNFQARLRNFQARLRNLRARLRNLRARNWTRARQRTQIRQCTQDQCACPGSRRRVRPGRAGRRAADLLRRLRTARGLAAAGDRPHGRAASDP